MCFWVLGLPEDFPIIVDSSGFSNVDGFLPKAPYLAHTTQLMRSQNAPSQMNITGL